MNKIWGMIQAGRVKQGLRRPRGQWMNIPPGKYARARWGKSSEPGVENRKVSDVFEFQEFKEEVSTCFRVGDAILEGPEVTNAPPGQSTESWHTGSFWSSSKTTGHPASPGLSSLCQSLKLADSQRPIVLNHPSFPTTISLLTLTTYLFNFESQYAVGFVSSTATFLKGKAVQARPSLEVYAPWEHTIFQMCPEAFALSL